jgi:replication factor C small subunit
MLQSSASIRKNIDAKTLSSATSVILPGQVRRLIELALKGEFLESRTLLRELTMEYGVSGSDLISQIHRELFNLDLPDEQKIRLVDVIGEYEFRIVEGSNETIQLEALLAQFALRRVES